MSEWIEEVVVLERWNIQAHEKELLNLSEKQKVFFRGFLYSNSP